ncbi:MAG: putative ABC transporter permease [Oscillospiraceae bacterium]|nr:putative ABC transporter permease [Oscillospiraceae bacterium]
MKKWRHKAPDIDKLEAEAKRHNHFAIGQGFYKMFWVFFIGSFAGIVIETIWNLITRWEFRICGIGLLYGPFNLVYGCGALVLALSLNWLKGKRDIYILMGGFVIGSAVEYVSSWLQEVCFGVTSWDYSNVPFNLQGRINLLFSLLWGMLAIVWVKDIYPRLVSVILKIPSKIGRPLTWVLAVFMLFNIVMSGLAVGRWEQRVKGFPPSTAIGEYLDEHYPDQRMHDIFPGMNFLPPKKGEEPPG